MKIHVTDGDVKIRHVGLIELDKFYTWLQRWFEFKGYWEDDNEELYKEIIKPGTKNIEMMWKCQKSETEQITYNINIQFILVAIKDVEIQKGDKKLKMQQGDFELVLSSHLELEEISPKFLSNLYYKTLAKRRIDGYFDDLYDDFYALHSEIKEIFNQYVQ